MGVARCDRQGIIVEMNPAFERALGLGAGNGCGDARALRLCDLVCAQERDEIEQLAQEVIDARRESFQLQARGTSTVSDHDQRDHAQPNNDWPRTEWTVWRIPDAGDGAGDSLLLMEDLAANWPADDRLQQRQKWEAVGRLAGGVFHDFNNLLTGVMLYCELLLAGLESGDRLRRYADEIRSASLHASGIVRQLLVLARQGGPAPQLLSLNDIATGMQNLLARLIGENIDIRYHLAPDLGLVKIDPAQAQQVLLNLVLNARDALPDGGEITVETNNCKLHSLTGMLAAQSVGTAFPCILLVVADNGGGMDAQTRRRLFDPFFTTKIPGKGNGLGLTTVHKIVSGNGGLIHVDSEAGRRTRMMILLPRAGECPAGALETPIQDSGVPPKTRLQAKGKELIL
jgi:two-component system, cell cycle sensor histidine kinase and response regulator CckA